MCLGKLRESNYFLFELFVFVRLVALLLPSISKSLLIQDKICTVNHGQSVAFCQNIQNEFNTTEEREMKDIILAESARFGNYTNLVESIAMVVWSLFVGSFLDKFNGGTLLILSLNIVSDLFTATVYLVLIHFYNTSAYYLILASLSVWFTGGTMSFSATAYRYISINTNEQSRVSKFVILEIVFIIGISFSVFMGGQLLRPITSGGPQLRTYAYNFYITLLLDVVLVLLLLGLYYMLKNRKKTVMEMADSAAYGSSDNALPGKYCSNTKEIMENDAKSIQHVDQVLCDSKSVNDEQMDNDKSQNFLKILFDLDNVKQTLHCFFKRRPHNVRLQIYLMLIVLFDQVLVTSGLNGILLGFAQKVYHWSATTFSTMSAVQQIAQMILLAIASVLVMRVLKLQDRTLILLAILSIFCADLLRGLYLRPVAFFISIPIGSLSGLGVISIKSKLSKIIPPNEIGKIFSLSSTIEALVPIAASLIYSNLFSVSIGTYPGLIYLFSCVLMIFSTVILLTEWFFCPVKSRAEFEAQLEAPKAAHEQASI